MNKAFTIILFVMLICATCYGQRSFQGLTPGQSTRADVERVLGQPVREVSDTLSEYKSDKETEKIFVQYSSGSSVVERIEAAYPNTIDRSTVVRSLNLANRPTNSQINKRGKLEEYFATANVVLTFLTENAGGGVGRVGYYSRELFISAVAKVPRSPQNQERSANADSPAAKRLGLPESTPRASRSSTSSTVMSTESGKTTLTSSRPTRSANRPSTPSVVRIPDELKDPQAAIASTEMVDSDKEISVSGARLESLVGRYEFEESDVLPSLKEAIVDQVDGELRWNAGSATHMLIHTGVEQESNAAGRVERDKLHFKLAGKPGAKVQFILVHAEVIMLLYLEDKAGRMIIAVGTPTR